MDGYINGCKDGWIYRWNDRYMDGWMMIQLYYFENINVYDHDDLANDDDDE